MSVVPGLSNQLARFLLSTAIAVENHARWWNRLPPLKRGGVIRGRPSFPIGRINHRDRPQGFDRRPIATPEPIKPAEIVQG